jgi:hypothetical protein
MQHVITMCACVAAAANRSAMDMCQSERETP